MLTCKLTCFYQLSALYRKFDTSFDMNILDLRLISKKGLRMKRLNDKFMTDEETDDDSDNGDNLQSGGITD